MPRPAAYRFVARFIGVNQLDMPTAAGVQLKPGAQLVVETFVTYFDSDLYDPAHVELHIPALLPDLTLAAVADTYDTPSTTSIALPLKNVQILNSGSLRLEMRDINGDLVDPLVVHHAIAIIVVIDGE